MSQWNEKNIHKHPEFLKRPYAFKNHNSKKTGHWVFIGQPFLARTRFDEPYRKWFNSELLKRVKGEGMSESTVDLTKEGTAPYVGDIIHKPEGDKGYISYCGSIRMKYSRAPTSEELKSIMDCVAAIPSSADQCADLCALRVTLQHELPEIEMKPIFKDHYIGSIHGIIRKPSVPVHKEKNMCINTSIDFEKTCTGEFTFPPTPISKLALTLRIRVFSQHSYFANGVSWCNYEQGNVQVITEKLLKDWKSCTESCGSAVTKLARYCTHSVMCDKDQKGCNVPRE